MKLIAIVLMLSLLAGCAGQSTRDSMATSGSDAYWFSRSDAESNQTDAAEPAGIMAAMFWITLIAAAMASGHYSASYQGDGLTIHSDNLDR